MPINVPNQITLARLVLAIVFVALLSGVDAARLAEQRVLLQVSFWTFLVAVLTDILDGYIARATNSVTSFGRIIDPVVDKVIVCGAFVLFASPHFWTSGYNVTGVAPWMAVVILARELLVSAVRSHAEGSGTAFAAVWAGKAKMFLQSVTACVILGELAFALNGFAATRIVLVWATVFVTAASAILYMLRARQFLFTAAALGGAGTVQPSEGAR